MAKTKKSGAVGAGALAVSLLTAAVQELGAPREVWLATAILAGLLLAYAAYLYFFKEDNGTGAAPPSSHASVGRDSYGPVAGRDIHMAASDPRDPVWRVAREVAAIRMAVRDIAERRDEFMDAWAAVTAPLPTARWDAHGGALDLSPAVFAVVAHAYELAEEYNDGLRRSLARRTFGDPVVPMPDLHALDQALRRAEAALRGVGRS